jgi:hypothetical protein
MTALALLLATIGVADLFRQTGMPRLAPPIPAGLAGLVMSVVGAWAVGLDGAQWWIVPLHLLVLGFWLIVPSLSWARAHSTGLLGIALAAAGSLALGDHLAPQGGPLARWYDSLDLDALDGVTIDRFLLAAACLVFLHSSANVIVRLVLADSGPQVLASEESLKGGRILGPLERWFLFAAALAGQAEALAVIVAAKGIVRFPEISRHDNAGNKAEYVLVGSFVSWFLAFVFVPLLK